jgi:hypothetical protein
LAGDIEGRDDDLDIAVEDLVVARPLVPSGVHEKPRTNIEPEAVSHDLIHVGVRNLIHTCCLVLDVDDSSARTFRPPHQVRFDVDVSALIQSVNRLTLGTSPYALELATKCGTDKVFEDPVHVKEERDTLALSDFELQSATLPASTLCPGSGNSACCWCATPFFGNAHGKDLAAVLSSRRCHTPGAGLVRSCVARPGSPA